MYNKKAHFTGRSFSKASIIQNFERKPLSSITVNLAFIPNLYLDSS